MIRTLYILLGVPVVLAVIIGGYAAWYAYHRSEVIAQAEQCNYQLAHPDAAPKMRAPDGTMASVMTPCLLQPTPPSLINLLRGRTAPDDVPERMRVNPYTFWDVLLGRYSASPDLGRPCDQSATTTDCSTLLSPQQGQQPYVPPNPTEPTETWVSATGTPISLYGFSFELPAGWHGSVYQSAYTGDAHVLVQSDSDDRGFTIDCPPSGKGLEAATRISSEERSVTVGGIGYAVSLEKWTAPGNDPWYFLWVRALSTDNSLAGTYCLVQGGATPDIEQAMRLMYESWK